VAAAIALTVAGRSRCCYLVASVGAQNRTYLARQHGPAAAGQAINRRAAVIVLFLCAAVASERSGKWLKRRRAVDEALRAGLSLSRRHLPFRRRLCFDPPIATTTFEHLPPLRTGVPFLPVASIGYCDMGEAACCIDRSRWRFIKAPHSVFPGAGLPIPGGG
jgi:hypothetical protein